MTGYDRTNPGDETPADAMLRRVLAETGATRAFAPPDDFVQRTLRSLPASPPPALYQVERSRRVAGMILRFSSLIAVVLLAALSGWGALGGVPQLDARDTAAVRALQAAVVPQTGAPLIEGLVIRATLAAFVGLGLLVPSALLLGRWPNRTGVVALMLARRPLRALALGLPLALLLSALLPLALQLALTVVGLPLAALLITLAVAPQVVGVAALARAVGARFEGGVSGLAPAARKPSAFPVEMPSTFGWPTAATVALMVFGLVTATVAAPLTAVLLFALLAAPGLGAVVLSRVGTRLDRA